MSKVEKMEAFSEFVGKIRVGDRKRSGHPLYFAEVYMLFTDWLSEASSLEKLAGVNSSLPFLFCSGFWLHLFKPLHQVVP